MDTVCMRIRKKILEISHKSGRGHIPTSFSIIEILMAVYGTIHHRPTEPAWGGRDICILSKGHGALAHFVVLAELGYFPIEEVYRLGCFGSRFGCHADRLKVPGIEASTGSLGHGIGLAVGMALGLEIKKSDRRVYVIIGDGEANEGSVWEAVLVAVHRRLHNLTIIYDDNRSHSRGLQISNPAAHFRGFGCHVYETDGHDLELIKNLLMLERNGVNAIIARTEKGHGCPTLVRNPYEWHGKSPNESEFTMLMEELSAAAI